MDNKKGFGLKGFSLLECVICLSLLVLIIGLGVKLWQPILVQWRHMQDRRHYSTLFDTIEVTILSETFSNYFNWASQAYGKPKKILFILREYKTGKTYAIEGRAVVEQLRSKGHIYQGEISLLDNLAMDYEYGIPLWVEVYIGMDDVADEHSIQKGDLLAAYPLMKRRED